MSLTRVLIERARPQMIAAQAAASAALVAELSKGCQPDVATAPVDLEPAYRPLRDMRDLFRGPDDLAASPAAPARIDELIRLRVYLTPEEQLDWICAERFVKQLASLGHRAGLEVCGNAEKTIIMLLCHRSDLPTVHVAFSAEFPGCELTEVAGDPFENLAPDAWAGAALHDYYPGPPYSHLLTQPGELHHSPLAALFVALRRIPAQGLGLYQCLFQPVDPAHAWHPNVEMLVDLEFRLKLQQGFLPTYRHPQQAPSGDLRQMAGQVETKAHNDKPFFAAALRVARLGDGDGGAERLPPLAAFASLFQHGGRPVMHLTESAYAFLAPSQLREMFQLGLTYRPGFIVNSRELVGLVHLPPTVEQEGRPVQLDLADPLRVVPEDLMMKGTPVGTSERAGHRQQVYIPPEARRCHTHVIGTTYKGKSSLMAEMILADVAAGTGVAVLDPHGDLVERLLGQLPESAIERTIHFTLSDPEWIPLWNPMQPIPHQDPDRLAGELVGAIKSSVTGWGDRLEHLLRQAFFALLHRPGSTLLDVANLLREKSAVGQALRNEVVQLLDNEAARLFWREEFARYGRDATGPPQHKLGKLLLSEPVYLMFSQPESAFQFRTMMDEGRILLVNLAGLDLEVRKTLGCVMLSLLYLSALSRSDTPTDQRRQFYVYCDEGYFFVTDSMEDLIAQTCKFGVGLTLAHQMLSQFSKEKADALAGVGSTIIFNVGDADAQRLAKGLHGQVDVDQLMRLGLGEAILRTGPSVVRINTPRPRPAGDPAIRERIIAESRRRYYKPASVLRSARRRGLQANSSQPAAPLASVSQTGNGGQATELTYDVFA